MLCQARLRFETDIQVLTYLEKTDFSSFWLYSVSHTYQYSFSTSKYTFHGILLEKRVSQQVVCISQEASLTVCDTPACSGVIKMLSPEGCASRSHNTNPTVEGSKTLGRGRGGNGGGFCTAVELGMKENNPFTIH